MRTGTLCGILCSGVERRPWATLYADVAALVVVPGFDNSAMDGYAVRYHDVASANRIYVRLARGQIHDSNSWLLAAAVTELGAVPVQIG